jgi:chromate transporter
MGQRTPLPELFTVFTRLGLMSFGGPIAHLGYFRDEFVGRRKWLSDADYADLLALTQFLPGPASSQAGFAIGFQRAGLAGGLTAFAGFTWPSALIMFAAAFGLPLLAGGPAAGLIAGLKIAAVAVVAHAVLGMARSLCPDAPRAALAVLSALAVTLFSSGTGQLLVIGGGLVAGLALVPRSSETRSEMARRPPGSQGTGWLILFAVLLAGLPALAAVSGAGAAELAASFYQAGALVFGGGHVVLPLLEAAVVPSGWVSAEDFLAGYGAAQAIPGPLFTFATYLGALADNGTGPVTGALLATGAVFLPGFLLLLGTLPVWGWLRRVPAARAALAGVNAAVVGILAAALYQPIWTGSIRSRGDFALALVAFAALTVWRWPAWRVVILTALGGLLLAAWPAGWGT